MEAASRPRVVIGIAALAAALFLVAARSNQGSAPTGAVELPSTAAPTASAAFGETEPPAQLFVLGDSLSDVGNAAALADWLLGEQFHPEHTVGLCNPADVYVFGRGCDELFFRKSRVTDGPVAVEHLAAHLGLPLAASFHTIPERPGSGTNYAVASAKAAGTGTEDLPHQLDRLIVDYGPLLPPAALYVLMIGGNDAVDALQAAAEAVLPDLGAAASDVIVAATVDAIGAAVERLVQFGARNLLVANVPDLTVLPALREHAETTPDPQATLAAADSIVRALNERLGARLAAIAAANPLAAIVPFDLYSAVRGAAAAVDGRNSVDACFDSIAYRALWTAARVFHPDCEPRDGGPPRFAEFFFWDGLHPTGAAHAEIGRQLIGTYVASAATHQPLRR